MQHTFLPPFFKHLTHYLGTCAFFQQESASAHTANHSMQYLKSVFGHTVSMGLGPPFAMYEPVHTIITS